MPRPNYQDIRNIADIYLENADTIYEIREADLVFSTVGGFNNWMLANEADGTAHRHVGKIVHIVTTGSYHIVCHDPDTGLVYTRLFNPTGGIATSG